MLCEVCSNIFHDDSLEPWLARTVEGKYGPQVTHDKWLPHQPTAAAVRQAADAGCHVCLRVLHEFPVLTTATVYTVLVLRDRYGFLNLQVSPTPVKYNRSGTDFVLEQLHDSGSALGLSEKSLAEVSTGGQCCMDLAKFWLDDCLRCHARCSASSSRQGLWNPTRLLKLEGDTVRLVQTSDEQPGGPYATLSHCWGPHDIDMLTPENLEQLKIGRQIETFLPSFRDCYRVCQSLEIHYLWIDSFCIMQGPSAESIEDWERESVLMENIYANSLLNIGASHASSSLGGCFQDRQENVYSSIPHRLQWRPTSKQSSQTYNLRLWGTPIRSRFNNHHLFSRAWVVQEQLLSRRMLHFGRDQIWWQCAEELLLSEGWPSKSQIETCTTINTARPAGLEAYTGRLHEFWNGIMNVYSRCGLTMPEKDKYRAIQAISSHIARTTADDFVEGFFWSQLPKALCWMTSHDPADKAVKRNYRAQKYRAPSWSWASMDCELYFSESMDVNKPGELLAAAICTIVLSMGGNQAGRALVCLGKVFPLSKINTKEIGNAKFAFCGGTLTCHLDEAAVPQYNTRADLVFFPINIEEGTLAGQEPTMSGLVLARCPNGTLSRIGQAYAGLYTFSAVLRAYQLTRARLLILV